MVTDLPTAATVAAGARALLSHALVSRGRKRDRVLSCGSSSSYDGRVVVEGFCETRMDRVAGSSTKSSKTSAAEVRGGTFTLQRDAQVDAAVSAGPA